MDGLTSAVGQTQAACSMHNDMIMTERSSWRALRCVLASLLAVSGGEGASLRLRARHVLID